MIEISRAQVDDAARILELQKLAYQSEARLYNDFEIPPLLQTLAEMRDDLARKIVLKAVVAGEIVGSVRAFKQAETVHIERLIVRPEHQKRGLGTALMQKIETFFPGASRFELFTGHKSAGNIRLYERLGYTIFKSEKISVELAFVFMEKNA